MQRHTQVGYEMLGKLDLRFPEVEECVTDHHERLNGSGYPQKKQGAALGPAGSAVRPGGLVLRHDGEAALRRGPWSP